MRSLLTLALLAVALNVSAQTANPTPNLTEAGVHLEKDGKLRTAAMGVSLLGVLIATAGVATADGDADQQNMALMVGGTMGAIGIVLNFSAAGHAKKAGRALQGKPL